MEYFARLKAKGKGGRRLAVCLLAVVASAAITGQDDDAGRAFFSVSSNRTYAPGEKPAIQLWAHNVKELEFRIYRVEDPLHFFQSLQDAHRFGGQTPSRPPEPTTPLERFHQFKRTWRSRVRDLVRAQFSAESRADIREMLAAREAAKARRIARTDSYATVPLLNPQRLVTVWRQPIGTNERWDAQTVPVEVRDKGLYLVEATNGRLRAFTIVLVTDLAILTKSGPGRVFAQLVNRRTGAPAPNASVLVLADRKEVARTESRADGTVDVAIAGSRIESVLVMARAGADFAVNGLYGYNIGESSDNWTGYLYTDRPVYRPGHKVSFRAILRQRLGAGYAIPALREVEVLIEDPDSKPVLQKRLPVSSVGTLHGEMDLPVSAALGYYSLSVRSGESQAYGGFHVEEYKKPEYEVKVLPDKRRLLQGEPVEATVEARYYFGEPVANAKVTYAVHRSRYWSPLFYEYEPDEEEGEGAGDYADEQIAEGAGQLDESGRLRIRLPNEPRESDVRYRIEARVTDQANREISGSGYVVATVGTFLVRVEPKQYVYEPGDKAAVVVEARDYDGNPVDQPFELEVAEWRWNRPEGPRIFSAQGRTGPEGKVNVPVTLGGAGAYIVRVKAPTPENRVVTDTSHIWIAGGAGGWYTARERIQIVPDRKSYKPGDTAKVLIVTGVPEASVIVSSEGADLHTLQVVRAKGPTVTVDVPIRREYAPNFFVTAAFVRDNQFYQGTKSIRVPPVEQQLAVRLTSSKAEYKPGEPSVFRIEARDHLDKPVRAEFSLGVVDEAIYAIRKEIGQDILNFFYGRAWNRIYTGTSLSYYFEGEAGTRVMQLAQARRRKNLAQLKPERLVDPAVRKAFPDTAFWVPDLATDTSGRAEARFSFPDALTTWRATARGVTTDTRVGSAVHRVTVRKNLILRLSTPRFFREGDEVTIPAIVQNYLASAKTVRVSLDVQGADVMEGATRDVEVASRASTRADYRLRIRPGARVVLLGKALTDEESDALELTIPVQPYGVKYTQSRAGSLSESGQATAELAFPSKATPGSRAVEIRVSPSLAGAIFSALEYLTSYPYGCTEQTMSSFLPNVIVSQAAKGLGLKTGIDEAELGKKIRIGLDRLYEFQHEDGGWGWWKTDESDPFMTAYVLAGLAQANAAGVRVRPDAMSRAAGWLRPQLAGMTRGSDLIAYAAYALALAGANEQAILDAVARQQDSMTAYGLALYGLALQQAGRSGADEIATRLERLVKEDGAEAYWPVDRDTLMDFHGETTAEATAYAVKLLTKLRPASPLLPKAVAWLVNHRHGGYYWNSTKQTAMVIYGITDYLKSSGELKPDFSLTVSVNGRQLLARRFTASDALSAAPQVIRLSDNDLGEAKQAFEFRKNGPGTLYWSAEASHYAAEDRPVREGGFPLGVRREYFKLSPGKQGERIVYGIHPLDSPVSPGDLIAVRLVLEGQESRYLFIEDPIPAGTEAIERDDLYEIAGKSRWWNWWYTRRELRDDRVALFQTYFGQRNAEFWYLLKVVNPGRFRISPTRASGMYEPGQFATSEPASLEVRQ